MGLPRHDGEVEGVVVEDDAVLEGHLGSINRHNFSGPTLHWDAARELGWMGSTSKVK